MTTKKCVLIFISFTIFVWSVCFIFYSTFFCLFFSSSHVLIEIRSRNAVGILLSQRSSFFPHPGTLTKSSPPWIGESTFESTAHTYVGNNKKTKIIATAECQNLRGDRKGTDEGRTEWGWRGLKETKRKKYVVFDLGQNVP